MNAYAVVQTGGKQYRVKSGDVVKVDVIPGKSEGDTVELTTLAAHNGTDLTVGAPELGTKVTGTVLEEGRGKKIVIFKKKRRSQRRVKRGHRQNYLAIRIDSIPAV